LELDVQTKLFGIEEIHLAGHVVFYCELSLRPSLGSNIPNMENPWLQKKLDDGWPESEKDVFQAALRMVVVKDSH
jgi:hypothetical protein